MKSWSTMSIVLTLILSILLPHNTMITDAIVITDEALGWVAIPLFIAKGSKGFVVAGKVAASRKRRSLPSRRSDFVHIPNQIRLGAPLIPYRNDFPFAFPGSHLISDLLSMVNYYNFEKLPEVRVFGR